MIENHVTVLSPLVVLVTGGRNYSNREFVFSTLTDIDREVRKIGLLVNGACGLSAGEEPYKIDGVRGADGLATSWAIQNGVDVKLVPADWAKHGRKAGPIRNSQMLDMKPDLVVAFRGGAGTNNCVAQAIRRAISVLNLRETRPIGFLELDRLRQVLDAKARRRA